VKRSASVRPKLDCGFQSWRINAVKLKTIRPYLLHCNIKQVLEIVQDGNRKVLLTSVFRSANVSSARTTSLPAYLA